MDIGNYLNSKLLVPNGLPPENRRVEGADLFSQ